MKYCQRRTKKFIKTVARIHSNIEFISYAGVFATVLVFSFIGYLLFMSATSVQREIDGYLKFTSQRRCLDGQFYPLPPRFVTLLASSKTRRFRFLPKRRHHLDMLGDSIMKKYFQAFAHTFSTRVGVRDTCRPRVIEASCVEVTRGCGGLGNRLHGLVATFYLALLSNSIFVVDWKFPTNWHTFYEPPLITNQNLFNLVNLTLDEAESRQISRKYIDKRAADLANLTSQPFELQNILQSNLIFSVQTNSLGLLNVLASHPAYSAMRRFYRLDSLSVHQMASVALRILTKRKTHLMARTVEKVSQILRSPKPDLTVGIQIRFGGTSAFSSVEDKIARVSRHQIPCFVEQLKTLIQESKSFTKHVVVFGTSDSIDGLNELAKDIRLLNVTFISLSDSTFPITHLDRSSFDGGPNDAISKNLRTFVDWTLLAEFTDYLLISRSTFGQTAALVRMTKTLVFDHRNKTDCSFKTYV